MFAALALEREPLHLHDVPALVSSWFQDWGGFAAFALVVWALVYAVRRRRMVHGDKFPSWASLLFVLALGVSMVAYLILAVLKLPEILHALATVFGDEPQTSPGTTRPGTDALFLTIGGAAALLAVTLPLLVDLLQLRLSWRRIWALARLSFKEAVRRKVLWAFSALLLVFLFGSWFLPYDELKPEDQVRNYVTVIYWAMTPLLLFVASLIAAFSIPTDIKQQTIHTILTKPVERFEIVLGRFLGYTLLMTLVLFFMTGFSLVYVARGVSPEAAYESFKARVPLYGDLLFEGTESEKRGGNVGKEWDYRGYISGKQSGQMQGGQAMPIQYAIWSFHEAPKVLAERGKARCEFNFDIYRTTKGLENKGVFCAFTFETARWEGNHAAWKKDRDSLLEEEKLKKEPKTERQIDDLLAEKYGYYEVPSPTEVVNNHTKFVEVPSGLFRNAGQATAGPLLKGQQAGGESHAPLRVRVQCISDTQFLGMAKYDLYWRLDDPDSGAEPWLFASNFFKGAVGLWLRLCLVIGVAVALSTYLTGVISWLITMSLYLFGLIRDFTHELATGTNLGGGPAEAALRLVQRENPLAEMDKTATVQLATSSDHVFRFFLRRIMNIIPDVDRFDFADRVREGINISGVHDLLPSLVLLVLYVVPFALLAYYLIKWREVATS